jgi:hypothetical protein
MAARGDALNNPSKQIQKVPVVEIRLGLVREPDDDPAVRRRVALAARNTIERRHVRRSDLEDERDKATPLL